MIFRNGFGRTPELCAATVALMVSVSLFWPQLAKSQSLNLPLNYTYDTVGGKLYLVANIGFGNQAPQTYLFDTGATTFTAEDLPGVFGSAPPVLEAGVRSKYGSGVEYEANIVGVPSVTFYSEGPATKGVEIVARTATGAPSAFAVSAAYWLHAPAGAADPAHNGPVTALTPFFGKAIYGDFGAGDTDGGLTGSGVLAQAVVPGTSAGYIVAANGASLRAISALASVNTVFPGAYANGPQGAQNVSSCSPCVILGLTPALVAQFQARNTLQWTATNPPFYNSNYPSSARYGVQFLYSLSGAVSSPTQSTPTQFDTGTSQYELGKQPIDGEPSDLQITLSGSAPGAQQIVNQAAPPTPYQVMLDTKPVWNAPGGAANIIGLPLFLQNSVMFNIAGQAIAYSSNFVTDVDILTTPANPLVIDGNSVPLGLAGDITGSGGVTIGSGGSATLSGANGYTGLTSIAGGYLALAGPGAISASSGVNVSQAGVFDISGSGGTFLGVTTPNEATIQSLSGDSTALVWLGRNDLILSNASGTFGGSIAGSGGLTLLGGTEVLTGASSYSGPTTIDGGTLEVDGALTGTSAVMVNAGGALTGSGLIDPPAVTIGPGGAFAPGVTGGPGASMAIVGGLNLEPGSFYRIALSPSESDAAHVSGAAVISGTAQAMFAPGLYHPQQYSILTASSVSGTFSGLETLNLPANFAASLAYSPDDVTLGLAAALGGPGAPSFSANERRVAAALNGVFNSGAAMLTNYQLVYAQTGAALSNAVNALSGEAATGAATASISLANQFLSLMLDPLVSGPADTGGVPHDGRLASPALGLPHGWNVWASGFGGSSSASGDAATGSHNALANAAGVAAGMDYAMAPGVTFGLALAGSNLGWGLADGLGGGSGNAFQAGIYGAARRGPLYLAASAAFAQEWLSTNRAGALGSPITANTTAQDFAGRSEIGDAIGLTLGGAQPLTFSPYVALQAQTVQTPSYAESDLTFSGFGLSYASSNQGYARGELGVRVDAPIPLAGAMTLNLSARAAYGYGWLGSPTTSAAFETLPGAGFTVNGATLPRNAALLTAQAELSVGPNLSAVLKLDGAAAPGANALGVSATLHYAF